MMRVKAYLDFICIFAGFGFVGMWAFSPAGIAASLSPGLQIAGIGLATAGVARFSTGRRRRSALPVEFATSPPPLDRSAHKRWPKVTPREEFGLRKRTPRASR